MYPIKKQTDKDLIAGIKQGGRKGETCTTWLFKKYKGWVISLSNEYDQNEEDVLNAYLDGLLALINQIKQGQFKGDSKLSTYFYRIVKNKCIDAYRKNTTYKATRIVNEKAPDVEDTSTNFFTHLINTEEVKHIKKMLCSMDSFCKDFLIDALFQDYLTEELIEKYGFSNARQVRNKKFLCLQNLRTLLGKRK